MRHFVKVTGIVVALTWSWLAAFVHPAVAQTPDSSARPRGAPLELEGSERSSDPGSAPADGAEQAAREEAARRFEAARSLYAEGQTELAASELERAYEIVPDQRVLYNLGQLRLQLGQYARARRALERYLEQAGGELSPERRERVEADLEMLRSRTGTLQVTVKVEGAEVFVNDAVVGQTPLSAPLLLDAGEHRVEVRKSGYETSQARVLLGGTESKTLDVPLKRLPERPAAQATSPSKARPRAPRVDGVEPKSEASTWVIWSAAGALGAGAAVTGVLGIVATNELDTLKDDPDATRSELTSTGDRAESLLLVSDILAGASLVAAGAALYLTLSDDASSTPGTAPKAGVTLRLSPTHVGVVAPLW